MEEHSNTEIKRTTEEELQFWKDQYFERREAAIQSQDRERVLREALQTIFNATSKRDYSTNEFNTVHRYARKALEASK